MILFFLGLTISYLVCLIFAGRHEGDKINKSLRFKIGEFYIHIHHWIIGLVLFFICSYIGFTNYFILGIIIGLILQGISYKDRTLVVYKATDFSKIYEKFRSKK